MAAWLACTRSWFSWATPAEFDFQHLAASSFGLLLQEVRQVPPHNPTRVLDLRPASLPTRYVPAGGRPDDSAVRPEAGIQRVESVKSSQGTCLRVCYASDGPTLT